jgi:release factor glutamine methyltransferase
MLGERLAEIYAPREDSYFLMKYVNKLSKGRVLDMGTGSGILALAALNNKRVYEVIAVDNNEDAIRVLNERARQESVGRLKVLKSNLFSRVKGKFDTIIFNPPYLPSDEAEIDSAIDGGRTGSELLEEFLSAARHYVTSQGIILVVYSSKTGGDVGRMMLSKGFEAELLEERTLPFFERLIVAKLTVLKGTQAFGKGKRGLIFRQGSVCVKEKNPVSKADTLANEAAMLSIVNKRGIGPKIIDFDGIKLKRKFIDGIPLEQHLEQASKSAAVIVLKNILSQCRALDLLNINKTELTNPYKDIIVTSDNKPVMIDFERSKKSLKPQNVTQFLQYIAKKKLLLSDKGLLIDKESIMMLGRKYKESYSADAMQEIISIFD